MVIVALLLLMLASAILVWMEAVPSLLALVRGGGRTAIPVGGGMHCMKVCWGGLCVQESDSEVLLAKDSGQSCKEKEGNNHKVFKGVQL